MPPIAARKGANSLITRRHVLFLFGAATGLGGASRLHAGTAHEVQALNRHPENARQMMVFYPAITRIEPGASVEFVMSDRGHNVESFPDMLPDGAESFRSRVDQGLTRRFNAPGTHVFCCRPHRAVGMIGFVLVGDFAVNLDAVRDAGAGLSPRPLAERFAVLFAKVESLAGA
ncbi:MAG: hypothetical protein JJT95_04215 [Pararhodobacter sp.]|nr:hypothetical protein [Pararhodobacter sp.]